MTRSVEVSATPWHVGGTFMPDSPDPRQNIWSKPASGMASGCVVARDVRVADAPLIAAAPELLAALKDIQKKFWEVAERHDDRSCDYDVCAEVRAVVAAIKKAEGRS